MKQLSLPEIDRRRSGIRTQPQFIRLKEVMTLCGISRTSIYDGMKTGRFPAAVKLGGRSSAWIKSEVDDWIHTCIRTSRKKS